MSKTYFEDYFWFKNKDTAFMKQDQSQKNEKMDAYNGQSYHKLVDAIQNATTKLINIFKDYLETIMCDCCPQPRF